MIEKQASNSIAMEERNYYDLFLMFIDKYIPDNFQNVRKDDPIVHRLSQELKNNNQFFYIADMIELQIIYVCHTCINLFGVEPTEIDPAFILNSTHPDDYQRHGVSRGRTFRLCTDILNEKEDFSIISSNFHFKNYTDGNYINHLVQGYIFTSEVPKPSTYCIFIHTDINWFGKIKHGYHYYIGKDVSYFRLPDEELILTGCIFTDREYEILKLLKEGLDSHEIGEKLFLSTHTVDTHRRNILKKSSKRNTSELIFELLEKGFF